MGANRIGTSPAFAIPEPATDLVGRDGEVAAIVALLRRPGIRLVTLVGTGGVGKTRLALAAAAAADGFPDGTAFVDLAPVRDAALVPEGMASALGIAGAGKGSVTDRIAARLRDREMLIVLDNVEHVLDATPAIARLLAACPGLRVLATSREPLRLAAEQVVLVEPLPAPGIDEYGLRTIADNPAVDLFVRRARAADPGFVLDEIEAAAVAAIVRRLGGLPLAIELAAARIRAIPPRALLPRLDASLTLLTGGPRDAPDRHRTLRDAIAWSCDLLGPDEQASFRRLAVFVGGFTLDAAEAVVADDAPTAGDVARTATLGGTPVVDLVASLLAKSLIRRAPPDRGSPRFAMLESIREFALGRLAESGEGEATRLRHARFALARAESFERARARGTGFEADELVAERDNMHAALAFLHERGDAELGLRLVGALWPLWLELGEVAEGRRHAVAFQPLASRASAGARATGFAVAGALAQAQGDHDQAATLCEHALAAAAVAGDEAATAMALTTLGLDAMVGGDLVRAADLLARALESFRAVGDARAVWPLRHLGSVAFRFRRFADAVRLAEEGLAVARAAGWRLDTARLLHNFGVAVAVQGELARAIAAWEEAVDLYRQAGDVWGVGDALASLGRGAYERGDFDRAAWLLDESLLRLRAVGDPEGTALALVHRGWLARARGDLGAAAASFGEGRALARKLSSASLAVLTLIGQAAVALDRGDPAGSARSCHEALRRATGMRDRLFLAQALERTAILATAAGRAPAADRMLAAAHDLRIAIGAPPSPTESGDLRQLRRLPASANAASGGRAVALGPAGFGAGTAEVVADAIDAATTAARLAAETTDDTGPPLAGPHGLTRRELDVLMLMAAGRTDQQIADALFLSRRTVTTHASRILAKLGVANRAEAAAMAARAGLT